MIDTVVYFQITDPKLFAYGVARPIVAIENLTATTLRNIIGQLELDESLSSRDLINTQMRAILDEATDPWGIKVNRVEVKNIQIHQLTFKKLWKSRCVLNVKDVKPFCVQKDKRNQRFLLQKVRKSQLFLKLRPKKRARILDAEAIKESKIRQAEGEAEAILKVQEATAPRY